MSERSSSRRRWRRRDTNPRAARARLHRVFFALWPEGELCTRLGAAMAPLLERLEGRRLEVADWHVTVCFVGLVSDVVLTALQAAAAGVTSSSFTLRFDRLEYWPEARVVAATVTAVPAAAVELARALRELSRALDLRPDEKPLRPHLTLMRGVRPLAWHMNQARDELQLRTELDFTPALLHLAESCAPAAGAPATEHSYLRLASWPLGQAVIDR